MAQLSGPPSLSRDSGDGGAAASSMIAMIFTGVGGMVTLGAGIAGGVARVDG